MRPTLRRPGSVDHSIIGLLTGATSGVPLTWSVARPTPRTRARSVLDTDAATCCFDHAAT
jgi:hypothetical protein